MNRLISKCPACHGTLRVTTLQCPDCGMELRNTFDLGPFDRLDKERFEFLITFLKDRGNLKEVQSDMQISYPTAKKKLDELLAALNLGGGTEKVMPKEIDVSRMAGRQRKHQFANGRGGQRHTLEEGIVQAGSKI